ncbi:LANO_0H21088g1_1 [Lachancea nothofagi CBS 11611]|uniref:LANO_0H21088g1_1 n=1 Tax=Lachancea nothofagi CBS 11611 TaxID=1266666 RepID=A0A1G4KNC0_9SACH|nr:LANO_0H21088g1_1 [Lachancea nothofagi CBS 11611]
MRATTNNEDLTSSELELSSLSSSDSFEPKAFEGKPVEIKRPAIKKVTSAASAGPHKDMASVKSNGTFEPEDSQDVEKVVTHNVTEGRSETVDSLKKEGLDLHKKAAPDFINPDADPENCEFPEEYNLETDTGLVKAVTLQQLNRLDSRTSARSNVSQKKSLRSSLASLELPDSHSLKSNNNSGLDAEKLRRAVEKNQKQIDKYKKRRSAHGLTGILGKLFK